MEYDEDSEEGMEFKRVKDGWEDEETMEVEDVEVKDIKVEDMEVEDGQDV